MPSAPGLHHSSDNQPGITRKRAGDDFVFFDAAGRKIRAKKTIDRLMALGIPPAYHAVWICPDPKGHLQATARDDRGRKQYIYHPAWNEHQKATKYDRLLPFARALGTIRRKINRDMKLRGMPKEKVLATLVKLLDTTYIRIGNEEYARENKSYGLTTFLNRHLKGRGESMRFVFKGKSGVAHEIPIEDKRVRKVVAACQDLPGQDLFEYLDDHGETHSVHSEDVNGYLQEIADAELTAKDFRTWHGTVLATTFLTDCEQAKTEGEKKKNIVAAVKSTAEALGNTVSVCRKCYIHPKVLDLYQKDELNVSEPTRTLRRRFPGLYVDELKFVALLEKW
jgi:DNA topoisomerase-1